MTKRSGSALLNAVVILLFVMLISGAVLQQFASWRVDYQRRLRYEQQQFKREAEQWQREQAEAAERADDPPQ